MPENNYSPFNTGSGAKEIHTGFDLQQYDSFSSDVDLVAAGPTGGPARQVIVLGAGGGTLEVVTAQGNTRELDATGLVGIPIVCGIQRITSNTNVGSVLVIW